MKSFFTAFSSIFFLLIFLGACTETENQRPDIGQLEEESTYGTNSYIILPIEMSMRDLEKSLEKKLPSPLIDDTNLEDDNLKLKVDRYAPLVLHLKDKTLFYELPLEFDIEAKFMGIHIGKTTPIHAKIKILMKSDFEILSDWSVLTHTEITSYEWIEKPNTKLFTKQMSLSGLADKMIAKKKAEIEKKIDALVLEQARLDERIKGIWSKLQLPIRLHKNTPEVYLQIHPQQLTLGSYGGKKDVLHLEVRLDHKISSHFMKKPSFKKVAVPPLHIDSLMRNEGFKLSLISQMSYHELNAVLAEKLVGKGVESELYQIKIMDAEAFGNGKELYLKLRIKGDVEGEIFLKGIPIYDTENQKLKVKDFSFDVKSEAWLMESANYLLNEFFLEDIRSKLEFSFKSSIEKVPTLIHEAVENSKSGKKIDIQVDAFDVNCTRIYCGKKGIEMSLEAQGKIDLRLDKL